MPVFFQGIAVEMYDVGVDGESSASWQFANQLAAAWKTTHKAERAKFVPRYTQSIEHRLEILRTRQIRFAVAPLHALHEEKSKTSRIKVVSLLWRTYLAAIVPFEAKGKVDIGPYDHWYIPEGSTILPTAFPNDVISYRDRLFAESQPDATIDGSAEESGFMRSLPTESHGGRNDNFPFDVPTRPAGKIVSVDRETLSRSPSIHYGNILFLETTGSARNLPAAIGGQSAIQSMPPQLVRILREKVYWLESVTYHIGGKRNIETVGMTMALFTHDAEDPELVANVVGLLNGRPYKFFPKSHLFENLRSAATKSIPRGMLHDAAADYYGAH